MINIYSKYYLNKNRIEEILKGGIIVFDTSALLDLYYYSLETKKEIFDNVFKYLSKRLWIPSQVYFEYLKNKDIVSEKPISTYKNLIERKSKGDNGGHIKSIVDFAKKLSDENLSGIMQQIKTLKEQTLDGKKHPYLTPTIYEEYELKIKEYEKTTIDFINCTKNFKEAFSKEIEKRITEIQSNNSLDDIDKKIQECFQIGKEYSYAKMIEIANEGKFRYEQQIPPGYKDELNKIGLQKYGDLYVWKQVLDYAHSQRKDFILVTNDVKSDWFEEDRETPRFELLKEFNGIANKSIWMLSMKNFLWEINSLLDNQLDEDIFVDIDKVQENKENSLQNEDAVNEMLQEVIQDILREDIYLIDLIPQNEAIRVFNNPYLYEAENEKGDKYRVVATIINGGSYSNMLHGMTNAFEIKKLYSKNQEHYGYYNFIIAKNKGVLEKCIEHLKKTKVRKMFQDKSIRTIICYISDGKIFIESTNYNSNY